MLISKMNYEHALKVGVEGISFGPGKYGEFSAAPTVDLTMARVDLNKRQESQDTKSLTRARYLLFPPLVMEPLSPLVCSA